MTPSPLDHQRLAQLTGAALSTGARALLAEAGRHGLTAWDKALLATLVNATNRPEPTTLAPGAIISDDARMEPRAISYAEVGRLLGISARSVERMAARGEIGTVRLGRNVRVPTSEVDRVVAERLNATDPSEAA